MTTSSQGRIVCGTDFSDNAAAALHWAGTMARRFGHRVDLVNVIAPPTTDLQQLGTDAAVLERALYQREFSRVTELAAQAERKLGVPVEPHVVHGDPPSALAAHAAEIGANLIVVGAYGHAPLERWLLGSVAERTVRVASRPVVVVPPPAKDDPLDARQVAHPEWPLKVLVGVDGEGTSDGAVELIRDLRLHTPCDVTVLHLYWPLGEYQRLGLQGSRDLFRPDPEVVKNLEPVLRRRIGTLPGAGTVTFSILPAWGEPAANLLVAAAEGEYDLLVVGAEERHGLARLWHPSTARRLVKRTSTVPVLCVPRAPRSASPGRAEVPRFSTVLAPTDLSPAGNAAIPYAYSLVGARGGVVELCHVREHSLPNPPYAYQRTEGRLSAPQLAELEGQLRALIPAAAEGLGISTHVFVIDGGHPAEAITQAAERLNVDVISLGSHGRGAAARALLGSVAQKVMSNSRKPVLLVR